MPRQKISTSTQQQVRYRAKYLCEYCHTEVPLFNPRQHKWSDHFIWSADMLRIIGLTPIGEATVEALTLNRERIIPIRAADLLVNRHPPEGDPIQEE